VIDPVGLDRLLPVQYLLYLRGLVTLDPGRSLQSGRSITVEIGQRFPATAELAIAATIIAVPVGALLGIASALRRDTARDVVVRLFSPVGVSVPVFWLALMAQIVVGLWLNLLPVDGRTNPLAGPSDQAGFVVVRALFTGNGPLLADALAHLILPALVLAAFLMGTIARMVRTSRLEVLGDDYVRTARAKGLRRRAVTLRHALPNALLPVITLTGLNVAGLLSGAILTETIFAWPGLGRYMYQAIGARDYPVVQTTTLLFAVIYSVVMLLVDVGYVLLDPRLRRAT